MPLVVSVSCPGELGDDLPHIEQLKERLFRQEHCGMRTLGWIHGFTLYLQESSRTKVESLLREAGCTIDDVMVCRDAQGVSSGSQQQSVQGRQPELWGTEEESRQRMDRLLASRLKTSPSVLPQPVSAPTVAKVSVPYEAQVEEFLHELEVILMERHLDPHDFNQLLTVAHEIVDQEDPDTGPHHGMIIVLEDVLKARQREPMPLSASA